MILNKELFEKIAAEAALSPRLRKNYDLRDSEDEGCQRMLNVLLPGTKTAIHRHQNSSETVVCIYGSAIERFYDDKGPSLRSTQGKLSSGQAIETEVVKMVAGSDTPGVVVEKGRWHSLEATNETGVVLGVKSGNYQPMKEGDIIK